MALVDKDGTLSERWTEPDDEPSEIIDAARAIAALLDSVGPEAWSATSPIRRHGAGHLPGPARTDHSVDPREQRRRVLPSMLP